MEPAVDASSPRLRLDMSALLRVHAAIVATPAHPFTAGELAEVAGMDRWSLARQFRAAFGTSPSRFRAMRRLDLAQRLMRQGSTQAEAALEAGFADQSHLSRMFKRAYGLTPRQWVQASR